MFCLLVVWLVKEQLAFCFTLMFISSVDLPIGLCSLSFVAWLREISFLSWKIGSLQKAFWLSLSLATNTVRERTCVAQPHGTLNENQWKIVFIWARIYFQTIKQPSSYISEWRHFWGVKRKRITSSYGIYSTCLTIPMCWLLFNYLIYCVICEMICTFNLDLNMVSSMAVSMVLLMKGTSLWDV